MYDPEAYKTWKNSSAFSEEIHAELAMLDDETEIKDRFCKDLAFGTGGLRGVMGAGTNRMNLYVVRRATKGLADYLLAKDSTARECGVAIAYDPRRNSRAFAEEAACVLCAAGIRTYLFTEIMPTPVLSFVVRHLGCSAGIVITASHNPKEYNGYKVYDENGCQIVPHIADAISVCIEKYSDYGNIPAMDMNTARVDHLLVEIGQEGLDAFLIAVKEQSCIENKLWAKQLKVIYTPLHGTGRVPVTRILENAGFEQVSLVKEQADPDGDFPSVRSPNPEDKDALLLAIKQAETEKADIVLGTDPDCDRIGVAVRHKGEYHLLTGNQIGALLVFYVVHAKKDRLSEKSTVIKTIVTGELGAEIARAHGLFVTETLTGFKYIGEQICKYEKSGERQFLIGYEESYGYLVGTHARDKDAVVSSMLICELAAEQKHYGRTLVDLLSDIYKKYGWYCEELCSYVFEGEAGRARIGSLLQRFRENASKLFADTVQVRDYARGLDGLPKEDVIKLIFADGSWLAARPSGTEPKFKIYYSAKAGDKTSAQARLYELQRHMQEVIG